MQTPLPEELVEHRDDSVYSDICVMSVAKKLSYRPQPLDSLHADALASLASL